MLNRLSLSLLVASTPITLLGAQAPRSIVANADVPITKVVLFSSGVGYFEHGGTVHGNGSTELRFKTSQINDILKSVVLVDQDGGRIGAITYPSQDPLAKTLKSFQIDITGNPSLAQLLNQLRGAHVSLQLRNEHLTGTILGVETREKSDEKSDVSNVAVLNLLTGAMIRSVELPSITNLSLDDPQLQDELTKALASLVQARDQDKKPVTINFNGVGDRRVRIGYVVETPVWKTSYRLVLDDKHPRGMLQGWAIVENQTESDWSNVSLSLVSGRPISFTMDLYQPLYSSRPNVVPELFAGLRPQVYEGGTAAATPRVAMAPSTAAPPPAAPQRRIGYDANGNPITMALEEVVVTGANEAASYSPAANGPISMTSSIQSMGNAAKLGELFQYSVGNVTLARQKSAMLPIITDSVDVERVSIYNESALRTNPLNGVWMKNTTGKHLLQGPITVLEKSGYAGDSRIDNVQPGQNRFLSYGIDLDMTVTTKRTYPSTAITSASINKGVLIVSRRLISSVEYAADNKSDKDKTLVIEHPANPGWKLIDTQKPFETTSSLYRFKGNAPANKVTTLVVKEEMIQAQSIALINGDPNTLLTYVQTHEISQKVRDALTRAIQLKQAQVDLDRQINQRNQQIGEITSEQNRIRENMKTVAQAGDYYNRLLAKLNEQESTIERLQRERADLTTKRDAARRELEDYVNELTIE